MKLTGEQQAILRAIIEEGSDVIVNAFAGTGKTTTISKALEKYKGGKYKPVYIVYNRKNRKEAIEKGLIKFADVQTFHSLAYKYAPKGIKERVGKLTFYEVTSFVEQEIGEKNAFVSLALLNHLRGNFKEAEKFRLWAKVDSTFLKNLFQDFLKWQREKAEKVDFDALIWFLIEDIKKGRKIKRKTIFVDEAQDINAVQEKLVELLADRVVAIGDTHQQIYSWRGASGSLLKERREGKKLYLTISWRIPPNSIQEEIANRILEAKGEKKRLQGMNLFSAKRKRRAVIARTNISLIEYALQTERPFYFIRPVEEILSLPIDIYRRFFLNQPVNIHRHLYNFDGIDELIEFAKQSNDIEIYLALKFIQQYNPIAVAKTLSEREVYSENSLCLTTAHTAKGLEWEIVEILGDFPPLGTLIEQYKKEGLPEEEKAKMEEELNLFYVAVTRAKEELIL